MQSDKVIEDEKYASDTKIDFRITPYLKKLTKHRARELKKSISEYLRDLITNDIKNKDS